LNRPEGSIPSVLFNFQHRAIDRFVGDLRNQVLPLAFEALPEKLCASRFDAVFSMGVIYHRRNPLEHIRRIRHCLNVDGFAVIESLVIDGDRPLIPDGRYARMRNVWHIPTTGQLGEWMVECGFSTAHALETVVTTPAEQRSTPGMRFHSLADALHPKSTNLTVEGHPAPRRCAVIARP